MDREEYIDALRQEMVDLVAQRLSPVALKYGYTDVDLESHIKWRPIVLVLGNYSSGKSTLINELLGGTVQATGQAPTDDSFTIITHDDQISDTGDIRVTEERDGNVLLNDPQYPFANLKRHGQRLAAHLRLKKVNAPFLKQLALIDTPGMLDSVSERDRGYDYQDVIGELAQIADLVLVLFDPHKAGTVREAHMSLRETLPSRTFEDRVLFVLNRIDECASLNDLLRVYGTLCWNLSQMTGRKDIPMIRLTYSPQAQEGAPLPYLKHLANQREDLRNAILQAPRHRLDHLASYVETHGERLAHFLEALLSYHRRRLHFRLKLSAIGLVLMSATAVGVGFWLQGLGTLPDQPPVFWGTVGAMAVGLTAAWIFLLLKPLSGPWHAGQLRRIDELTDLHARAREESWSHVKDLVSKTLRVKGQKLPIKDIRYEHKQIRKAVDKTAKEIRTGINELATVRHG